MRNEPAAPEAEKVKPLPEAPDVERMVLGAVMESAEALVIAQGIVGAADFANGWHREIFRAVEALASRGEPVDEGMVGLELNRTGLLDDCGGPGYLLQCVDSVPVWQHVARYAEVVAEKTWLRDACRFGSDVTNRAWDDPPRDEFLEMLDAWEAGLAVLRARTHTAAEEGLTVTDSGTLRARLHEVEWAWPNWLPFGSLTLLAGESGAGKSALAMYIAAAFTGLVRWPDNSPPRAHGDKVLWYDSEATQQMFCSRLEGWGLTTVEEQILHLGEDGAANLRLDQPGAAEALAVTAVREGARLVVVDSLSGAHGADENDSKIRGFLRSIAEAARDHQLCFLCIHHLRKKSTFEGPEVTMDRLRGSNAVGQFSRVVWALSRPLGEPEKVRLEVIKSNWGAKPAPLGFVIGSEGLTFGSAPTRAVLTTVFDQAVELLLNECGTLPGRQAVIMQKAKEIGISEKTVRRAGKELGIVPVKRADGSYWPLPGREDQTTFP